MNGVRKALAAFVGVILLGVLGLVFMRLLRLSSWDFSWLRGGIWFIVILVMIFLGSIFYLLLRKPR